MKRFFVLSFVLLLTLLLVFPQPLMAESGRRNDSYSATVSLKGGNAAGDEIEIVKKVAPVGGWPKFVPSRGGKPVAAKGVLGTPLPEGGKRYAVVVGISDYPGDEMDIHYADDDAILVATVLSASYGFDEVRLLVDGAATRDAVLGAIEEIRGLESGDDEVVFYFSGHGARLTPARGQAQVGIVTWGAEQPMPYPEFIWDKELRTAFRGFETDRIICIFDCCLAGAMTDLAGKGRIICMASTQNGYAAEYGEAYGPEIPGIGQVNHGFFTYFFVLLGMHYGMADVYDHDGNPATMDVTIEEAYDFARTNLQAMSLASPELWQIPTIGDHFPRDLSL